MGIGGESSEEDGNAEWKAAIHSIANPQPEIPTTRTELGPDPFHNLNNPPLKFTHYQLKIQKALHDIVEKSIEIVTNPIPIHISDNNPVENESKIRLFKNSPLGIVFDHEDEGQKPTKRPRILPGKAVDEKSKKFRHELKSIAVNGEDILAAASDACKRSLARLQAKDAAAKEKALKEEERIAELKKIRGEKWLPTIAKQMGKHSDYRN